MQGINIWIWFSDSKSIKMSSIVYCHSYASAAHDDNWDGWYYLWMLNIAPCMKHFTRLLLRDKLKTKEYLFRLKMGPQAMCTFCGLDKEPSITSLFIVLRPRSFGIFSTTFWKRTSFSLMVFPMVLAYWLSSQHLCVFKVYHYSWCLVHMEIPLQFDL